MEHETELIAVEVDLGATDAATRQPAVLGKIAAVASNTTLPQVLMETLEKITSEDFAYMTSLNIKIWYVTQEEAQAFADRMRAENPGATTEGNI